MSKLTREQKIEIYKRRKQGENLKSLSKEYSVLKGNIYYMIKLIDEHGEDILRKDVYKRQLLVLILIDCMRPSSMMRTPGCVLCMPSMSIPL